MVRVLTEDDDLRRRVARIVERVEDREHVGVDARRPVLVDEELAQLLVIRLLELRIQQWRPIVMKNLHQRNLPS